MKHIIYGTGSLAKQVFYEATQYTPEFSIKAFCVADEYLNGESLYCGLPLIAESRVLHEYPPDKYNMLSCVDAPSKLRDRILVFNKLKELGYNLQSYVSPLANLSEGVKIGENNIILANSNVNFDICIGHSNTIRGTAFISHDVVIGNGTNICEGSTVGGSVIIGNSCWLGLNCTVNNRLIIADDTLIGSGAVLMTNTEQGTSYIGNPAKAFFTHKETGVMLSFKQY